MSLTAIFAPPVICDVLVNGEPLSLRFARIEFPQWAEWQARIKKDRRDYIRQCLQEAGAPDVALIKMPIEQTAKEIPLPEIAQVVTNDATYTRELLINQAIIAGGDRQAATVAVDAISPMERQQLANTLATEDFKQEADRPLMLPLSRNPPADLEKAIAEAAKMLANLKAMRPKTGPSTLLDSATGSPSSTRAA